MFLWLRAKAVAPFAVATAGVIIGVAVVTTAEVERGAASDAMEFSETSSQSETLLVRPFGYISLAPDALLLSSDKQPRKRKIGISCCYIATRYQNG